MTRTWQVIRLVLVAGMALGAAGTATAEDKQLQIEGSTTVGPIADAFAEAFRRNHPDVQITVKKTGSGDGVAALIEGRCDVANASRFMKQKEFVKAVNAGVMPVAHVVAMDGVSVAVHPSNPVSELSLEQIRSIYKGEITNWKDLGGPDTEIVVISRDSSSGTYETFHNLAMNKEDMGEKVEAVSSNPAMHARVSKTPAAIGYLGLGFLDKDVKPVKVEGVMPTSRTVASGKYPISRPLFMFTNGYPRLGSLAHEFVTFHLTERGQEIVEAKGFVPVTNY